MADNHVCEGCGERVQPRQLTCPDCGAWQDQATGRAQRGRFRRALSAFAFLSYAVLSTSILIQFPLPGIAMIASAAMLFRPIRLRVARRLGNNNVVASALLFTAISIGIGAIVIALDQQQEADLAFYAENAISVRSDIEAHIRDGDLETAMRTAERYRAADDPMLDSLITHVQDLLANRRAAIEAEKAAERAEADRAYAKSAPEREAAARAEAYENLQNRREPLALVFAERYVREQLKAPRTAKFGRLWDAEVAPLAGSKDRWVVRNHVDSENSFGAMLRMQFEVIVQFEPESYDRARVVSFTEL